MNSEGLAFYVQFIKRDASLGRFLSLVQFHPTWIARGSLVAARGDEPARSQNAIFSAQKDSCQCRFAISVRCAGANSSSVASTENELPTGVVSELQRECLLSELSFFLLPFHRAAAAQRKKRIVECRTDLYKGRCHPRLSRSLTRRIKRDIPCRAPARCAEIRRRIF